MRGGTSELKSDSVIRLDVFQTGVTSVRWRERFTGTGQTVTVTGQINGRPYYYYRRICKHPAPPTPPPPTPPPHTHTHTPTVLRLFRFCCSLFFRTGQTKSQPARLTWLVECCFTATETVGLSGTGAQDGHLDFHPAPEL